MYIEHHFDESLQQSSNVSNKLQKPFACDICRKSYNFEKNLTLHRSLHAESSLALRCPDCHLSFQRKSSYRGHIKNFHMTNDLFRCEICDDEFEYRETYEEHKKNGHNPRDKRNVPPLSRKISLPDEEKSGNRRKVLVCKFCGKKFPKSSNLLRHEMIHSGVKPYQCRVCSHGFSQKSSLKTHESLHAGSKQFYCEKCPLSFTQRGNLITHMKRLHPDQNATNREYPCRHCACIFSKLNTLNRHVKTTHSESTITSSKPYENDIGFSIDTIMSQLKSLQREKSTANEIAKPTDQQNLPPIFVKEAPKCFEEISTKHSLEQNIENNSKNNENEDQNLYVNLIDTLNPGTEKKTHRVRQISEDNVTWWLCSHCTKKFQRPYDLFRHIRVHTKEKPFECNFCGKLFSLNSSLRIHVKIHANGGKIYQCSCCGKRFSSLRSLDSHAKLHTGTKMFVCEYCGKKFATNHYLSVHKRTHQNRSDNTVLLSPINVKALFDAPSEPKKELRLYQCTKCGLKLKRSSHLKDHESTHSKLKPFKCNICEKSFTTKSSLRFHLKVHTNERTISCNFCPAKFFRASELDRHNATHKSERNFICPYCGKNFKTRTNCKEHIRSHKNKLKNSSSENHNLEIINGNLLNSNELNYEYFILVDNQNCVQTENEAQNSLTNDTNDQSYYQSIPESDQSIITAETPQPIEQNSPIAINGRVLQLSPKEFYDMPLRKRFKSPFVEFRDLVDHNSQLPENIFVAAHETSQEPTGGLIVDNQNAQILNENTHTPEDILVDSNNVCESENLGSNEEQTQVINREEELPQVEKQKSSHKCETCEKIFKKSNDLKRHLRTHTKEKPFSCDICSKSFSLKSTLQSHQETHNENRLSIDCQVCGKKYSTKSALQTHLRIHTGEKPYNCPYCSKSFRTIGHKLAHIKIHEKSERKKRS